MYLLLHKLKFSVVTDDSGTPLFQFPEIRNLNISIYSETTLFQSPEMKPVFEAIKQHTSFKVSTMTAGLSTVIKLFAGPEKNKQTNEQTNNQTKQNLSYSS